MGIGGSSEVSDTFGFSLASGDFNKDSYDDLAIGVPGEAIGNESGAGAVTSFIICDDAVIAVLEVGDSENRYPLATAFAAISYI